MAALVDVTATPVLDDDARQLRDIQQPALQIIARLNRPTQELLVERGDLLEIRRIQILRDELPRATGGDHACAPLRFGWREDIKPIAGAAKAENENAYRNSATR